MYNCRDRKILCDILKPIPLIHLNMWINDSYHGQVIDILNIDKFLRKKE